MASPEDPLCTKPRSQYVVDEIELAADRDMVWSVLQGLPGEMKEGFFFFFTLDHLKSTKWSQVCTLGSKNSGDIIVGHAERLSRAYWFCLSPVQWLCFRVDEKARFVVHGNPYVLISFISLLAVS